MLKPCNTSVIMSVNQKYVIKLPSLQSAAYIFAGV